MRPLITFILFFFCTASYGQNAYVTEIQKHRETYKADFITNPRSPLKEQDLKDLQFFSPDLAYRVTATLEILSDQTAFRMPTYDGSAKEYIRFAYANFKIQGKPFRLTLFRSVQLMATEKYKDYLFLPFTDLTNNELTYGGGRYIDLGTTNIEGNKIEIDFNRAYNPYCAYSSGYSCPIPPEENDLPIAIKAGEKNFKGKKKG